ncbi:MAG TPA: glutaredoxin family protein [Opitutales bacterium]|nr:glutaredoxin family protein [Opitutales bacterium]
MKSRPILYIKTGCPWCTEALSYFKKENVALDVRNVLQDVEARQRMHEISGQTLTPTFEYGDFVVADFDVGEFKAAVNKRPDIKKELGLGD